MNIPDAYDPINLPLICLARLRATIAQTFGPHTPEDQKIVDQKIAYRVRQVLCLHTAGYETVWLGTRLFYRCTQCHAFLKGDPEGRPIR